MPNKDQLQQELKEKIKAGIKPSDIKKGGKEQDKKAVLPPPIVQEEDQGYISEEEQPTKPNKQIKDLQNQVQFWTNTASTHLKNLQLAQAKVSNLEEEVKELKKNQEKTKKATELLNKQSESIRKAQELIKTQGEKIKELEKQAKSKENDKNIFQTFSDQPTNKTFFCDACQLTKQGEYIKRKADAPFEPRLHGRVCYLCSACSPYIKELNDTNFDKENNPYKY